MSLSLKNFFLFISLKFEIVLFPISSSFVNFFGLIFKLFFILSNFAFKLYSVTVFIFLNFSLFLAFSFSLFFFIFASTSSIKIDKVFEYLLIFLLIKSKDSIWLLFFDSSVVKELSKEFCNNFFINSFAEEIAFLLLF